MIKFFVSDLDGTLLNRWHLSDYKINRSVAEIKRHGYLFAVATGRHLRYHHRFSLKFLKQTDYFITLNGALVCDAHNHVIASQPIDTHTVQQLITHFPQISFECLTINQILVLNSKNTHFKQAITAHKTPKNILKQILNRWWGHYTYDTTLETVLQSDILKLECIVNSKEEKDQLIEVLQTLSSNLTFAYNDDRHFEITAAGANKKTGLIALLKHLKMHPDQVAVFGNDLNDVEMLQYFKHSYVTQQAVADAKEAAHTILKNSNQHAVVDEIIAIMQHQAQ